MSYDPTHNPQRQRPQDPYSLPNTYPPYDPQEAQPTIQSQHVQQYYPPQPGLQPYANTQGSVQRPAAAQPEKKPSAPIWQAIMQFMGVRGLMVTVGSLLALLAFFVLPYYSIYSGHFLAADVLDDKWWLEPILTVLPLVILIIQQVVPRLKEQQRRLSLVMTGSGVLGFLLHYWFLDGAISSNYWRLGAWCYFLGMALVAIGGLLLSIGKARR